MGKIRHSTSQKVNSVSEPQMSITNRKVIFLNEEPTKDRKIIKAKNIHLSDCEVKIKRNEIQKAQSCDFKKCSPGLKKNEKTKKSIFGCESKLILKPAINEKKNNSWNHFQNLSTEVESKISLAQKVSNVLSKKKGKSLLKLNLSTKALKKVNCKSFPNNQTKQFNGSTESSKKICSNEQLSEKSLSFQRLQYPNKTMDVRKSVSYITGSLKKPDKNFSTLQSFQHNLAHKGEALTNQYQIRSSLWDHMESSNHLSSFRNESAAPILSRSGLRTEPVWRYRTLPRRSVIERITNQSTESFRDEIFKSETGTPPKNDKNHNNQTWEQTHIMKKNLKICQCPHFHTEEGIKKVCLQSSPEEQEFGQKFFRVNYIPKDEVDESDGEKEYVDSWTTTEDEKTKPKITKNESGRQTDNLKAKDPEIIKKDSHQNCKPKNSVSNDPKCSNFRETPKSLAKTQKSMKQKENAKQKEEKNVNKTAAVEVETLRKLFTKLKSVDQMLKEENCLKSSKNLPERNSQRAKSKELTETDIKDDEVQLHTKQLKAEIVRHVQNWLDAEFLDS